ncbi:MAG: ASPIC/UnbV domain-containing protein [Chitinophagales bacterium]
MQNDISWGTAFFDFNHNTHLDLFVANGYIPAIELKDKNDYEIPNRLYQNNGNGSFTEIGAAVGLDNTDIARGMAVGDYDNDGDLDILVANIANHTQFKRQDPRIAQDHFLLYRNDAADGNWLKVSLEGTESNRDGYGAKVRLTVGAQTFVREIDSGSSHLSHSSTTAHFGLANHSEIDKIEVVWPGGKVQTVLPSEEGIFDGKTNQHIHIIEASETTALTSVEAAYFQVQTFPNPFSQNLTIQYQLPNTANVSAKIYNAAGILVADLLTSKEQSAGQHELQWNGKNAKGLSVPFGTYFCQLQVENRLVVQKIVYIRD